MPALDPALNQTIWWFLLGAFSGWLLWLLIDRLFWRDGLTAASLEQERVTQLTTELDSSHREESLLRNELVREQEETQRLSAMSQELRDKLDGQDQIVTNLEAALDAAKLSASASASLHGANITAEAVNNTTLEDTTSAPTKEIPTGLDLSPTPKPDESQLLATPAQHDQQNDGEQALRDLLAQAELDQNLEDLLADEDDLFNAPTEILTTTPDPSPNSKSKTGPNSFGTQNGPLSDEELDRLLDLDTQVLFGDESENDASSDGGPETSRGLSDLDSIGQDSPTTELGGHTLSMLERLRGPASEEDTVNLTTHQMQESSLSDTSPEPAHRPSQDMSLINRLRGAFGRKPSDSAG